MQAEGPRSIPEGIDGKKTQKLASLLYQQGGPLVVALLDVLFDNSEPDSVEFSMPVPSTDPDIRQWQVRNHIYLNNNAIEGLGEHSVRLEVAVAPGVPPTRFEPNVYTEPSYKRIVYKHTDRKGGVIEFRIDNDEVTQIVSADSSETIYYHIGPRGLEVVGRANSGDLIPLRQAAVAIGRYLDEARQIIADNQLGYFGEVSDSVAVVDDNEKNIDLASLKDSVTVADVAQIYGVTRQRVHALVRSGRLKPIQEISYPSGRTVRLFSRTDIESSRPARPANK